jgi:hypothetical protein
MKADLHLHTNFSFDGFSSPKEIVKSAIAKKIDCICITDHEEIRGIEEAVNFAANKPILIIPGIEIKSREGDILGLNIRKKNLNGLSAKETIENIIKEGGFPVIAHPFDPIFGFRGIEKIKDFLKEKGVAIEVWNASIFLDSSNRKAMQFAKELNLPFTAGSDSHSSRFVGKAYVEIPGENLSVEKVIEEIKKKNIKVGFEKIGFFEKLVDHIKRNLAKIKNYVIGKPKKIR